MAANCKNTSFLYNPEHERTVENQADGSKVITLSPRYDTGLHWEKKYITGGLTGAVEYEHYLYAGGLMFGKFIQNTAADDYTMQEIADHFGVHYATVSRTVKLRRDA